MIIGENFVFGGGLPTEEEIRDQIPGQVTLENFQDLHVHFRGDLKNQTSDAAGLLKYTVQFTSNASRVLAMPNVLPKHVKNLQEVLAYKKLVEESMLKDQNTEVLYTISLKSETTAKDIEECAPHIAGVKYYPGGVTTGAGEASEDLDINNTKTRKVLEAMQEKGIVLNLHPETTEKKDDAGRLLKGEVNNAEREFMSIVDDIVESFPNLKIVIEHISTKESVDLMKKRHENVYCTVTPQHLKFTANDRETGKGIDTRKVCKPNIKTQDDRDAIWNLVLSGNNKVIFGSDSAPHPTDSKEATCCANGCFSSPIAIELIVDWFYDPKTILYGINKGFLTKKGYINEIEELLQKFMSNNGDALYGKTGSLKTITLEKKDFTVPEEYGSKLKPICGGETLSFSVIKAQAHTSQGAINLLDL